MTALPVPPPPGGRLPSRSQTLKSGLPSMAAALPVVPVVSSTASIPCLNLDWVPAEGLTEAEREQVPALLGHAREATRPAAPELVEDAVINLLSWAQQFGLVPAQANLALLAESYRLALGDLPADLVVSAVVEIRKTWRFSKMPIPGDLRARIEHELQQRQHALLRLEAAESLARRLAADEERRAQQRRKLLAPAPEPVLLELKNPAENPPA